MTRVKVTLICINREVMRRPNRSELVRIRNHVMTGVSRAIYDVLECKNGRAKRA